MFIVHCSLFTVHCSLLIAQCSLLISQCSIFIVHCSSVIIKTEKLVFFYEELCNKPPSGAAEANTVWYCSEVAPRPNKTCLLACAAGCWSVVSCLCARKGSTTRLGRLFGPINRSVPRVQKIKIRNLTLNRPLIVEFVKKTIYLDAL